MTEVKGLIIDIPDVEYLRMVFDKQEMFNQDILKRINVLEKGQKSSSEKKVTLGDTVDFKKFKDIMMKWLDQFNIEDWNALVNKPHYLENLYKQFNQVMNVIYIVYTEHGDYEDRGTSIVYVGANKDDAYKEAIAKYPSSTDVNNVCFSIYENGKKISEIWRVADSDKWKWNYGDIARFNIFGITIK